MNSLYPEPETSVAPSVMPDPKQAWAEIDYLVEVFHKQTESLRKTGRPTENNVPADFQPDLPSVD